MLIDFRRKPPVVLDLFMEGMKVEHVNEYKYLGTVLDNKLTFTPNTDFIHKKCQQRMYCLQKLMCLDVHTKILHTFYRSFIREYRHVSIFSGFIESVLNFAFVCWNAGLSVKNKNVLNRVENVCSKVVGEQQESYLFIAGL